MRYSVSGLIRETRSRLGETQEVFAQRFGMKKSSTSLWESGDREAPNKVAEFCINYLFAERKADVISELEEAELVYPNNEALQYREMEDRVKINQIIRFLKRKETYDTHTR